MAKKIVEQEGWEESMDRSTLLRQGQWEESSERSELFKMAEAELHSCNEDDVPSDSDTLLLPPLRSRADLRTKGVSVYIPEPLASIVVVEALPEPQLAAHDCSRLPDAGLCEEDGSGKMQVALGSAQTHASPNNVTSMLNAFLPPTLHLEPAS